MGEHPHPCANRPSYVVPFYFSYAPFITPKGGIVAQVELLRIKLGECEQRLPVHSVKFPSHSTLFSDYVRVPLLSLYSSSAQRKVAR